MTEEVTQKWHFLLASHFTIVYHLTFGQRLVATGGSAGVEGWKDDLEMRELGQED